jgi:hypothetical protein
LRAEARLQNNVHCHAKTGQEQGQRELIGMDNYRNIRSTTQAGQVRLQLAGGSGGGMGGRHEDLLSVVCVTAIKIQSTFPEMG